MDKKSSLFVVFMPFQLFVAQQVIRQEGLKNCILIEGCRELYPQFVDMYELIKIDDLWKKTIYFEDISAIDHEELPFIEGCKKAIKNINRLRRIIKDNDVEYLYLGEIRNQGFRFLTKYLTSLGCKVRFFEEGVSHYRVMKEKDNKSIKNLLKIFISDIFYYLPFYHITFGKWRYNGCRKVNELPIDKRYSIVDGYYNETYDVKLSVQPMLSSKMRDYIKETIGNTQERLTLLMTDPVAEFIGGENMDLYYETIKEKLATMEHTTKIYVKFHHREEEEQKGKTLEIVKETGIPYEILAPTINIPVEYYLQNCNIKEVLIFNASTYIYNGYIFPDILFTKLLPLLYKKVEKRGNIDLTNFKTFINLMK